MGGFKVTLCWTYILELHCNPTALYVRLALLQNCYFLKNFYALFWHFADPNFDIPTSKHSNSFICLLPKKRRETICEQWPPFSSNFPVQNNPLSFSQKADGEMSKRGINHACPDRFLAVQRKTAKNIRTIDKDRPQSRTLITWN